MKKIFSVFILFLLSSFLYSLEFYFINPKNIKQQELNIPAAEYKLSKPGNCTTPVEVNPEEAYYFIIEKKPVIIDIRTPEEFKQKHLPDVKYNIDFYSTDFKDKLNKLDKNGKYLIYCRTGHRSSIALQIMRELGFKDIHHIKGGITAWEKAGYPVVIPKTR